MESQEWATSIVQDGDSCWLVWSEATSRPRLAHASTRCNALLRRCILPGWSRRCQGMVAGADRPAIAGLTGRGRGTCVHSRKKRHGCPAGPVQDRHDPSLLWRRIRSGHGDRLLAIWTERTEGRAAVVTSAPCWGFCLVSHTSWASTRNWRRRAWQHRELSFQQGV